VGLSARLTPAQLAALERCLPGVALRHVERDGGVAKAEDVRAWRPAAGAPAGRRLSAGEDDSFEANAALRGAPLDPAALSASGAPLAAPGEKLQRAPPRLWALDRLDQRALPLDGAFRFGAPGAPGVGQGVTIYSVDSGVAVGHQEFLVDAADPSAGSRASHGWDFIDDSPAADDGDGHGTHTAAAAAGLQVGVAKAARVVALRVLGDDGYGSIADTVAALDWIAARAGQQPGRAVAALSLGVRRGAYSAVLELAVARVAAAGVVVVVAAGNVDGDACETSPAAAPEALTVAASSLEADGREGSYFEGNQGRCVDIWAPGVEIYSGERRWERLLKHPCHAGFTCIHAHVQCSPQPSSLKPLPSPIPPQPAAAAGAAAPAPDRRPTPTRAAPRWLCPPSPARQRSTWASGRPRRPPRSRRTWSTRPRPARSTRRARCGCRRRPTGCCGSGRGGLQPAAARCSRRRAPRRPDAAAHAAPHNSSSTLSPPRPSLPSTPLPLTLESV
jgi:hypothetical protein